MIKGMHKKQCSGMLLAFVLALGVAFGLPGLAIAGPAPGRLTARSVGLGQGGDGLDSGVGLGQGGDGLDPNAVLGLSNSRLGPGVVGQTALPEHPIESGVERLKAASETDQIILAVGDGSGGSQIQVTYYRKSETAGWQEIFSVPGYCGHNGITAAKREGDRKSPSGDYRFSMAFGIYEDPGSALPYHRVSGTDYWVDDSNSSYYNQLVDTAAVPVSWNSAEHLIDIVPQYHYGLALDYNKDNVPGLGSAIFLHGYHSAKTWTEGCIAIPEEYVKQLLQQVDGNTRILIAENEMELQNYHTQSHSMVPDHKTGC